MYVLIDRERMRVLHKYPKPAILAELSWIECSKAWIFPLDNLSGLRVFTDPELASLYQSIKLETCPGLNRRQMQQAIFELMATLPLSDINEYEVLNQAALVTDKQDGTLHYVKGKYRAESGRPKVWLNVNSKGSKEVQKPVAINVPAQTPWGRKPEPVAPAVVPSKPAPTVFGGAGKVVTKFGA